MNITLMLAVEKDSDNEAQGDDWVPSPRDVARAVSALVMTRDLETGWYVSSIVSVV